jgi:hypothetical protein
MIGRLIELCMANGPTLPLPPGVGRGEGFFESPKNARFLEKSPSPSPLYVVRESDFPVLQ